MGTYALSCTYCLNHAKFFSTQVSDGGPSPLEKRLQWTSNRGRRRISVLSQTISRSFTHVRSESERWDERAHWSLRWKALGGCSYYMPCPPRVPDGRSGPWT